MKKPVFESAEEFLQERSFFDLGILPTEQPNPRTLQLSTLARENVPLGIQTIKEVDDDAFQALVTLGADFSELARRIHATLASGHRIFLCGCGATGRLSLALESIWRSERPEQKDALIGFMAGGDLALVRSVENFEDIPAFGARHLLDLGFRTGDLLLSPTEGGETPFVIGATEEAARVAAQEGGQKPYFLYCNPDSVLTPHVERSRNVILSPWIEKISIPTGPMALSGSTRLQASTVLMHGIGLALFYPDLSPQTFSQLVQEFREKVAKISWSFLAPFIEFESTAVANGFSLLYTTDIFGISILTDTTERSPTFSLRAFENSFDPPNTPTSLAYLGIHGANHAANAWTKILGRLPQGLSWPEYENRLSQKIALGFDFSETGMAARKTRVGADKQEIIDIRESEDQIQISFSDKKILVPTTFPDRKASLLEKHLLLKLILNIHSLLVMGRLGRYEKNIMTWVRPSNGKLIDRSVRYIRYLLEQEGKHFSYEKVTERLFDIRKTSREDEPIVLKVVNTFNEKN